MDLKKFAQAYRLKTKLDECGDVIIQGKQGHLYEYSATELGVMFMPSTRTPRSWTAVKKSAEAAGMTLRQNADSEGGYLFDPGNEGQL